MQAQPHCATAVNMGNAQFHTTDQNGNPGFCKRAQPGSNGKAWSSSCWKVRCTGASNGDSPLNNGITCKHNDWIYLKAVDTNMHNNLSLTDDQYTSQCAPVAESANTPSCRAFDMTVQAWNLVAVFSNNQGSLAGEPAGLNGVIPVEYEEVSCQDPLVQAAISNESCGLNQQLLI
jgi:hypothetical protein